MTNGSHEPKVPREAFDNGPNILSGVLDQAQAVAASQYEAQTTIQPSDGHANQPSIHKPVSPIEEKRSPHGRDSSTPIEKPPLPLFSQSYGHVDLDQGGLSTTASLGNDGRVDITILEDTQPLSRLLVPTLREQLEIRQQGQPLSSISTNISPSLKHFPIPGEVPPPLNIVIQVVGSRGDVQPFVALGKELKAAYGHRVRLATHPTFRDFVTEHGLEFFSIGGDPTELMAFMVKNPGLMPGKDALRSGDIGKRRKGMYEIMRGCWRSCFEVGDGTGPPVSDSQSFEQADEGTKPFVAEAIIANPPSFAHVHCAEKLGIPLHLMFTMPWSPTQSFPHPLANIHDTTTDSSMANFISYVVVELMTWQGLGDVVNRFREGTLGLDPLSLLWGPGMVNRLRIPYTYCWSPSLIPKPGDWASHISVSGFFFLSSPDDYEPPQDLVRFLESGPPPVYIGFGSIVVDDPDSMTNMIFAAIQRSGQRALVSKGWGGLGSSSLTVPDNIFMLGNVPHDWLFPRVSCVVHHGGAGTTAAGIASGKPTVVIPFFGDQPFWGSMIAKAGAGPDPIPHKDLDSKKLADAIAYSLNPSVLEQAQILGRKISTEQGSKAGAISFHHALKSEKLRCQLSHNRAAVWKFRNNGIRLSALAAAVLGGAGIIDFKDLSLLHPYEYDTDDTPWDPIGGGASALASTIASLMMGAADIPVEVFNMFSKNTLPSKQSQASKSSSEDLAVKQKDHDNNTSRNPAARQDEEVGKGPLTIESAIGAGKGVGRIVDAGLKSPMDFTLALAKGFHNAPKLYGDKTIRPVNKVTDLRSGIKAAGKGLGYGFYDGISGLVTQPLEGAKKEGLEGFFKGFGRGIGGVVLKPGAGFWGVPGYTFQGIYKELRKRFGSSVQNYIIAARTAQGYDEWQDSAEAERVEILQKWNALTGAGSSSTNASKSGNPLIPRGLATSAYADSETRASLRPPYASDEEYERAIEESVEATSYGNPEEDVMVERAIRASLAELRVSPLRHEPMPANTSGPYSTSAQTDSDQGDSSRRRDDPGADSDHDGNMQEALRRSEGAEDESDSDLQQAIRASKQSHQEYEASQKEEQTVMNYMIKQSLAEAKFAEE